MKQRIVNWLLKTVVRVVSPDDIIRVSNGKTYLGGVLIDETELRSLQAEAKALKSMRIWSKMNESVKQLVYERGWRDSTTIEHLNTAKAMYSVLETQNSIVVKILSVV
jgi:hypothetical protein